LGVDLITLSSYGALAQAAEEATAAALPVVETLPAFLSGLVFLTGGLLLLRFSLPFVQETLLWEREQRPPVPWGGLELSLIFAAIIFCVGLVAAVLGVLPIDTSLVAFIAMDLGILFGLLFGVFSSIVAQRKLDKRLPRDQALVAVVAAMGWPLGTPRGRLFKGLGFGAVGLLLGAPMIFGVMAINPLLLEQVGVEVQVQDVLQSLLAMEGPVLYTGLLLATIVGPILEELVFRGFVQPFATKNLGAPLGILVTSLAFGAIHGAVAFLPVFALSLVLGYLRERSGHLLPAIVGHCLWNSGTMAIALM
jgi:membrane protease YdiL (CAAX protease family)